MLYRECPACGASLDPEEKCDCELLIAKGEAHPGATERASKINKEFKSNILYHKEGEKSR